MKNGRSPRGTKRSGIWHQLYPLILITLQGVNISHLGKRKIIFKMPFLGDMLVPWRVGILLFWRVMMIGKCFKLVRRPQITTSGWVIFKKHHVGSFFPPWIISPLHNFCVFIGKFKKKTMILNPVGTASGQGLIQRSFEPAISLAVVIPSVASQRWAHQPKLQRFVYPRKNDFPKFGLHLPPPLFFRGLICKLLGKASICESLLPQVWGQWHQGKHVFRVKYALKHQVTETFTLL